MTAARKLKPTPTEPEILRDEIRAICEQIDRRNGTTPGTAERGLYGYYWPPHPFMDLDVLIRLHADALIFLHALTTTPIERTIP